MIYFEGVTEFDYGNCAIVQLCCVCGDKSKPSEGLKGIFIVYFKWKFSSCLRWRYSAVRIMYSLI
jgi:hypothetical protein